jgi:hypothetical protein
MIDIGNKLNRVANDARGSIFQQAEIAELTFSAFRTLSDAIKARENTEITFSYPVGYRPDRTTIQTEKTYTKEALLQNCAFLADRQLAANAIVQLVTIMEALFGDLVREVVLRFPQKIGSKRMVRMEDVLHATSVEDIHLRATDALLSELSYKSPVDFAESAQPLLSMNLLECPAFHKYVETKAARDVLIHNRGMVNETYLRKAGTHARAKKGIQLPFDVQYFLESYEACLQVTEWVEQKLHDVWYSSEYEDRRAKAPAPPPTLLAASDAAHHKDAQAAEVETPSS